MVSLPDQAAPPGVLPSQRLVQSVAVDASFQFHCHPGISCFMECCRELELALSPYDVIRLKQTLGLSSDEFLERYAIIEFGSDDLYPKVYLAMIDDGRASCPFVDVGGCRVYPDRPGACRTYPVGRGSSLDKNGANQERFIIVKEDHCLGFAEAHDQTVSQWQNDQQINDYNRFNDLLLPLLPRDQNQAFRRLSSDEAALYVDTLYNLEGFKASFAPHPTDAASLPDDDCTILRLAIDWLQQQWQSGR